MCRQALARAQDRNTVAEALLALLHIASQSKDPIDDADLRSVLRIVRWLSPKVTWPRKSGVLRDRSANVAPLRCESPSAGVLILTDEDEALEHTVRLLSKARGSWSHPSEKNVTVHRCAVNIPSQLGPLQGNELAAIVARSAGAQVALWRASQSTKTWHVVALTPTLVPWQGPWWLGTEAPTDHNWLEVVASHVHLSGGLEAHGQGLFSLAWTHLQAAEHISNTALPWRALFYLWSLRLGQPDHRRHKSAKKQAHEYLASLRTGPLTAQESARWAAALAGYVGLLGPHAHAAESPARAHVLARQAAQVGHCSTTRQERSAQRRGNLRHQREH